LTRTQSGKLILRVVLEKAGNLPVIVMGDFNCLPDSDPYRALTRDDLLVDARAAASRPPLGPGSTWNGFDKVVPDRIIDHIFVRGSVKIVSLQTLDPKTSSGRFASDHLPVQVIARLESPKATSGP
jgi:endonuclease/exonuclease/phosphatase family metal-dependent hydrolase